MRAKLRAEIVSAVAPQSPMRFAMGRPSFFLGAGTRQGPIEQFLQQLPSAPMGHGFMASARSNIVSQPSADAFCSIFIVAGSMLFFSSSVISSSFPSFPKIWLMLYLSHKIVDHIANKFDRLRMPHYQHIRPRQQQQLGGNRLHDNSPFCSISHKRRGLHLGLFRFPDLFSQIANDGKLQSFILLRKSSHTVAFHDGVGILNTVAQTSCGGINDKLSIGNAEIAQQDIELFSKVNVYRTIGCHGMLVSNGPGSYLLVIV